MSIEVAESGKFCILADTEAQQSIDALREMVQYAFDSGDHGVPEHVMLYKLLVDGGWIPPSVGLAIIVEKEEAVHAEKEKVFAPRCRQASHQG